MTKILLLITALVPTIAAAQSAPTPATTDNAGALTMVRAAGMPLNDGGLAPGMLTVRVVRGAFTSNLVGQAVEVHVTGGTAERAVTGADGRAQFAHLPVGAEVRASAAIGDEQLQSDAFVMPAESGVRILLVAPGGAEGTFASGSPATGELPAAASLASTVALVDGPVRDPESGVRTIRAILAVTTVFVFALFMVRRRPVRSRRRPDRSRGPMCTGSSAPLRQVRCRLYPVKL